MRGRFNTKEIVMHCESLSHRNPTIAKRLFNIVVEVLETAYKDRLTACRLSSKHKETILSAVFYIAGMLANAKDDGEGILPFTEQDIAAHFGVCERSVSIMSSFLRDKTPVKEMVEKVCSLD